LKLTLTEKQKGRCYELQLESKDLSERYRDEIVPEAVFDKIGNK
jgi:hypothetical protein